MRPSRSPTHVAVAGGERIAEVAERPRRRVDLRLERRDVGEIARRAAAATRAPSRRNDRGSVAIAEPSERAPGGALGGGQRDAVAHVERQRVRPRRRPRRRRVAAARARRRPAPSDARVGVDARQAASCSASSGYAAKPLPAPSQRVAPRRTAGDHAPAAARPAPRLAPSVAVTARRRRHRPRASAHRGRRGRASSRAARHAACASASSVGTATTRQVGAQRQPLRHAAARCECR